ncbi:MAG TPA: MFS transporter [Vicinamibacterales bacterium]|jgi:AAHS family 4-hydroxybenzoate transporter-like MFS transporter|nr:MFS transporter [Vicinamibacterales bacterium]
MRTIDVGAAIDEGRWTGYQKLLIFGTALTIILDGVDNQLLPNAVPQLIKEWGHPRGDFIGALSYGPFGMMIGGLIGGIIGDRLGRRTALLGSVLAFAALTFAIAFANSIEMLGALRFLAGVGLGGAMPNAATLASEYVPRKQRPFAVTLTIVCIPLGGVLAGELAARIIPTYGWRALFIAGGLVPVILAVALWKLLPESPRYLARHRERWPELTRTMRRIGHTVPDDVEYVEAATAGVPKGRATIGTLFGPHYIRDTLALSASFFFCLLANYLIILLLPAVLTSAANGFSQPEASRALRDSNFGGVAGAILGAMLIQRLGSRVTMLGMSALAVVCASVLAGAEITPQNGLFLAVMFVLTGGLLNAVQTTMYALAAHVFPTEVRSTGVGFAVAVGRVGNVLAATVANEAFNRGGNAGYFGSWAVLMGVVLVALALVSRHVPRSSQIASGHGSPAASH